MVITYVGYSGSIHGVFICIGYVSGMCRVCVETYGVQKRFSEMVLTTELHGTARKQGFWCLLALTRRNLINLGPSRPPFKGGVHSSPKQIATAPTSLNLQ